MWSSGTLPPLDRAISNDGHGANRRLQPPGLRSTIHPRNLDRTRAGTSPLLNDVIDAVFAYGSSNDGFLKTANPLEAYQKVAGVLKERAVAVGGNGVTFATFDYRVAVNSGCGGGKAFEVFAYGTAVRTRSI